MWFHSGPIKYHISSFLRWRFFPPKTVWKSQIRLDLLTDLGTWNCFGREKFIQKQDFRKLIWIFGYFGEGNTIFQANKYGMLSERKTQFQNYHQTSSSGAWIFVIISKLLSTWHMSSTLYSNQIQMLWRQVKISLFIKLLGKADVPLLSLMVYSYFSVIIFVGINF